MPSVTEICNLALTEAGYDETIESLTEHTVSGQRCNRLYDINRRELLCSYPWSFATKFKKLARVAEDIEGYSFAYAYPSEALRVTNVYSSEGDFRSRHDRVKRMQFPRVAMLGQDKVILSNYEEPYAEYVFDEKVTDNFSPLFVRLLYLTIAMSLAKLADSEVNKINVIARQIEMEQSRARMQSVNEDDNVLPADDEYIKVRG